MTKAEVNSLLSLTEKAIREMSNKGIATNYAEKFRASLLSNQKELLNTDLGPNIDRIKT